MVIGQEKIPTITDEVLQSQDSGFQASQWRLAKTAQKTLDWTKDIFRKEDPTILKLAPSLISGG